MTQSNYGVDSEGELRYSLVENDLPEGGVPMWIINSWGNNFSQSDLIQIWYKPDVFGFFCGDTNLLAENGWVRAA